MSRFCWAVIAVFVIGMPTIQAQTKLAWKFKEGDTFYVEDVMEAKQTVAILGKDIKEAAKTTKVLRFHVKKVADNEVTVEQTMISIEKKNQGGLPTPQDKFVEKLQGASFVFTMRDGKVTKLDGYDEFIKKATDDDVTAKLLKTILSKETITQGIETTFGSLPKTAVKAGDEWTSETKTSMGPLGTFANKLKFKVQEEQKDGVAITSQGTATYTAPKDGVLGGVLKIVKGNLKAETLTGSMVFDADKGRLVRSESTMKMAGALTVEVMGNELEMSLSVEQTSKARVLDKNPKTP